MGNYILGGSAWIVAAFIGYMSFILGNFASKGGWSPFKLSLPAGVESTLVLPPFDDGEEAEEIDEDREEIIGLRLSLLAPRTNPHIGKLLPVEGVCREEFTMNGSNGWYLFDLEKPLSYSNHDQNQVIVKCKVKEIL